MKNPFTKAYCEVTFVDSVIILVSIFVFIFLGVVLAALYESHIQKKINGRK